MNRLTARISVLAVPALAVALSACGASSTSQPAAEASPTGTTGAAAPDATSGGADSTTSDAASLVFGVPDQSPGRCAVPSVRGLKMASYAFAGTVSSVTDGNAVIAVDEWYLAPGSERPDQITLRMPPEGLSGLIEFTTLRPGQDYLVSASKDKAVTLCGFTGPATPELTGLYDKAF